VHSPVAALLWERWRRTRWAVAIAFALPAFVALLAMLAMLLPMLPREVRPKIDHEIAVYSICAANLVLFVALLLWHCERDNVTFTFPPRMLRLPWPTWRLVAVDLAYAMAIIALLWAWAGALGLAYIVREGGWSSGDVFPAVYSVCIACLAAMAIFAGFQAGGRLFGQSSTGLGLAASIVTLLSLFILVQASNVDPGRYAAQETQEEGFSYLVETLLFATVALSYCVSWFAVSLSRRGGVSFGVPARLRRSSRAEVRRKPFASAHAAQRWFEFRQVGYQFPIMAAIGLTALAMIPTAYVLTGGSGANAYVRMLGAWDESFEHLLRGLSAVFAPAAWAAGLIIFALRQRERSSSFVLTRPLSTRSLAEARLRVGLRSIALGLGLFILAWIPSVAGIFYRENHLYWNWTPRFNHFMDEWVLQAPALSSVLSVLGVVVGLTALLWVAWWMRPKVMVVLSVLGVGAALYVVPMVLLLKHLSRELSNHAVSLLALVFVGIPLLFAGLAAVIWGVTRFRRAHQQVLISRRTLVSAACAWPVLAWGGYWFFVFTEIGDGKTPCLWALFVAGAALLPFALVPQALHRQRHK
jgi:hypothetical protein